MPSRDIGLLHPSLQAAAVAFIQGCAAQGVEAMIICTWRNPVEQAALYAQGRAETEEVNAIRADAGMAPITDGANHVVTRAKPGQSAHENVEDGHPASLAFDACPVYRRGEPFPGETDPRWQVMGAVGMALGLNWYGRPGAPFKEYPHFQAPEG